MLTSEELKKRIDKNMVLGLMEFFGIVPFSENEEYIIFPTCCHSSCSPKLYYYIETNSFYCWSQCGGQVDIISIVQEQEGLEFQEAIEWLINFFQLGKHKGFGRPKKIEHKPREIKKKEIDVNEKLPQYNESILNTFYDIPIIEWLNEGISKETMDLFGIKFDINTNSIIISVKDINGGLVGIRQRNLDTEIIERYGKYIIYTDSISKIMYKFSSGKVLYGLNLNKDKIIKEKKIAICEGEKSVLKTKTWFKDEDITVASFGCNLTDYQIEIIKSLGVKDIYFMWDREEDEKILKKMERVYKKCSLFFDVWYIKNYENKINIKDSPMDKGRENFIDLVKNNLIKYETM